MGYITQEKDYWIHSNALSITLNALGNANRIQCSVSSGAVIMAFIEGDTTLGYNAAHNYKSWPMSASPTYFNTNTAKYVYVAIPRTDAIGTQAVVVFPSEKLDIDGKNESDEQIGSTDYLYIYIGGHISAVETIDGVEKRRFISDPSEHTGKLDTDQGRAEERYETEWYSWSAVMQTVTFLKKIVMAPTSWFHNLILGDDKKELTGVATAATGEEYVNSETLVVTPSYLSGKYLSKTHDDTAAGNITFQQNITVDGSANVGGDISAGGNATITGDTTVGGDADVIGDVEVGGDVDVTGKVTAAELIANLFKTPGFKEAVGLVGQGFGVKTENGRATMQTDDLIVLGRMFVNSLNIREVSYIGGVYLLTPAGSTVERVMELYTTGQNYAVTKDWTTEDVGGLVVGYRVLWKADDGTTSTMNYWKQGDQAFCEIFNINKAGHYDNFSNRRYWRLVCRTGHTTVDGKEYNYADLSDIAQVYLYDGDGNMIHNETGVGYGFFGYEGASLGYDSERRNSIPAVDDKVVCLGSQADKDRQAAIQLSAEGVGSFGIYDNINFYGDHDNGSIDSYEIHFMSKQEVRMRASRFSWTTNVGVSKPPTVYCGEWSEGNTSEWGYEWTYNGVNWLCIIPQGQTTNEAPGTTPAWWVSNQGESGKTYALGFYTDEEDPTPIMGLAVRPAHVDEKVVPYLLYGQDDITDDVYLWLWQRESNYKQLDDVWGDEDVPYDDLPSKYNPESPDYDPTLVRPKRRNYRMLHITTDDLPTGWDADNGKVGFKCTATFTSGGEQAEIINRISIV